MSLFHREQRSGPFPQPIVSPFLGTSVFGRNSAPSMESALQVSAVWACVRLIADAVSMMPVHAFTLRGGVRVPVADPPLLTAPSADATMPEWLYMLITSLMLRGNAYGTITARDSMGYPAQVELLNPDEVQVRTDRVSGQLTFTTNGGELIKESVFHQRAFRTPGSRLGLSPITYAASQIQTDAAISEFALGYFRDGAHPSAILSSDSDYNQEQARTIKERFISAVQGREPAILTGGMKYTQIQVSPEESQFLATQKMGVAHIARIFGVPPEMIAAEAGNSMTYANVEQRSIDFLTYSVQPWLTRIESALGAMLPGQKHVRFDTSVLLRTDVETRVKAGAIAIASKQQTPDEVRAWSDLPPLTDEQKAWLAIIPLDVSATGMPKGLPMAPAAAPATEGEAA